MCFKNRIKSLRVCSAILLSLALSFIVVKAHAQPATSCAPELMQAMEARAWMETDREYIQTMNLMTKPDSVLEYSCFDQLVSLTGELPAEIFSDDETKWLLSTGGLPHIDNVSTDIALQEVVGIALFTFLFSNHGHTYLGDRTPLLGAVPPRSPGDFDCGALNYVWEQAKCIDFGEYRDSFAPGRTEFDMFYDFYWYENNDPRDLPLDQPACTVLSGVWDTAIATSFNDDMDSPQDRRSDRYILPESDEVLFSSASPYGVELVQPISTSSAGLYVEMMVEQANTLFNECMTIPTGVQVTREAGISYSSVTYGDATCPNPQCYFDQSACVP